MSRTTPSTNATAGSLQAEIQQTRPFASLRQEASLGVLRTADMMRRKVAETVEAAGVTLQQYNVLRILRGAGDDGLPTLTIGERMIERTPGVTRLVDKLEARGWVERERSAADRRQVVCRITDSGLVLLAGLDEPVSAIDHEVLGMLDDQQVRSLMELLDQVRAGL